MAFTDKDIKELHGKILGTKLDNADFISTGLAANRTTLSSTERIVTRLLNSLETTANAAVTSVNAFKARFTAVAGDENGPDKDAFNLLGGSLIQVVSEMQKSIEDLAEGRGGTGAAGGGLQGSARYSETITGDGGTTEFPITHGLGTQDVGTIVNNVITGATVLGDIQVNDENSVTIFFAVPPAEEQSYKIIICG
jgi:methyl-accepting chemotaxis protein